MEVFVYMEIIKESERLVMGGSTSLVKIESRDEFVSLVKGKKLIGFKLSPILKEFNIRDLSIVEDYHDLHLAFVLYFYDYLEKMPAKTLDLEDIKKVLGLGEEADDLYTLKELYKRLQPFLQTSEYYKSIEKPMIEVVADIQVRGLHLDLETLERIYPKVINEVRETTEKLRVITKNKSFNPNSTPQVSSFLGVPKVNKEALKMLKFTIKDKKKLEFIDTLLRFREVEAQRKPLGRYIEAKGHIKGNFLVTSAQSGRMSSFEENLQQIKRDLKALLKPPKGKVYISIDFPQIELRLASLFYAVSFHKLFKENIDIHTYTAQQLYKKEDITKEERKVAKACNFGLLYGMQDRTFQEYLVSEIGSYFSLEEASRIRKAWFATYKDVAEEHQRVKAIIEKQGYYEDKTILGRPYKTTSFTKALNIKIQGSGADLLKIVAIEAFEYGINFVNLVHDELVCIVDDNEDYINTTIETLKTIINKTWLIFVETAKELNPSLDIDYVELPLEPEIVRPVKTEEVRA